MKLTKRNSFPTLKKKNIKFNSRTNCPMCGKKKPFKYVGECPECEEEKEAYKILQEQNSNYWHDVAGSIK